MAEVDPNEYNGGRLVGATIALLALSWITIGLRTYTRAVIMRSFQSDDWLMLVAQVSCPTNPAKFPRGHAAHTEHRLSLHQCARSSLKVCAEAWDDTTQLSSPTMIQLLPSWCERESVLYPAKVANMK
jgi:hypothetical protein